jgi:hypothetical protein
MEIDNPEWKIHFAMLASALWDFVLTLERGT